MRYTGQVGNLPRELFEDGPLVEVTLGPHPTVVREIQAAGGNVPSVRTKLMLDTGTDHTMVENALVESINISPHDTYSMVGISQKPEEHPVYLMSIILMMRTIETNWCRWFSPTT